MDEKKASGSRLRALYWLMGDVASSRSLENKILIYKSILKPVWLYGCQLWGRAANSSIQMIERFQAKVLRCIVDAPWYVPNEVLRRDLSIPLVREEIDGLIKKYTNKLEQHTSNPLASVLSRPPLRAIIRRIRGGRQRSEIPQGSRTLHAPSMVNKMKWADSKLLCSHISFIHRNKNELGSGRFSRGTRCITVVFPNGRPRAPSVTLLCRKRPWYISRKISALATASSDQSCIRRSSRQNLQKKLFDSCSKIKLILRISFFLSDKGLFTCWRVQCPTAAAASATTTLTKLADAHNFCIQRCVSMSSSRTVVQCIACIPFRNKAAWHHELNCSTEATAWLLRSATIVLGARGLFVLEGFNGAGGGRSREHTPCARTRIAQNILKSYGALQQSRCVPILYSCARAKSLARARREKAKYRIVQPKKITLRYRTKTTTTTGGKRSCEIVTRDAALHTFTWMIPACVTLDDIRAETQTCSKKCASLSSLSRGIFSFKGCTYSQAHNHYRNYCTIEAMHKKKSWSKYRLSSLLSSYYIASVGYSGLLPQWMQQSSMPAAVRMMYQGARGALLNIYIYERRLASGGHGQFASHAPTRVRAAQLELCGNDLATAFLHQAALRDLTLRLSVRRSRLYRRLSHEMQFYRLRKQSDAHRLAWPFEN
ncbi:unnamed protein product [Trichogramma brassicae]|uniref:Uncharacterized protein n=1 Tax=Trichogramma brassicae TaxID=86971 RepID=A0A6H5HYX0_9HYME|nr:unnamed protein product [Trichogramma brassicae]